MCSILHPPQDTIQHRISDGQGMWREWWHSISTTSTSIRAIKSIGINWKIPVCDPHPLSPSQLVLWYHWIEPSDSPTHYVQLPLYNYARDASRCQEPLYPVSWIGTMKETHPCSRLKTTNTTTAVPVSSRVATCWIFNLPLVQQRKPFVTPCGRVRVCRQLVCGAADGDDAGQWVCSQVPGSVFVHSANNSTTKRCAGRRGLFSLHQRVLARLPFVPSSSSCSKLLPLNFVQHLRYSTVPGDVGDNTGNLSQS